MNDLTGYVKSGQLIKELKAGEESAFDFLFRSRYKKLCRVGCFIVGDPIRGLPGPLSAIIP